MIDKSEPHVFSFFCVLYCLTSTLVDKSINVCRGDSVQTLAIFLRYSALTLCSLIYWGSSQQPAGLHESSYLATAVCDRGNTPRLCYLTDH